MSQPALSRPEFDILPSPSPISRPAARVLTFPQLDARESALPDATTRDGNCLKGLGFALVIEAGAALCLYGAWQLWQIFS